MTSRAVATGVMALVATAFSLGVARARWRRNQPTVHRITIENMAFHPAVLAVSPGDTVVWVNDDLFVHSVTAQDSAWTSPPLERGRTWRWVARSPGRVPYHCAYHPTMLGELTVIRVP